MGYDFFSLITGLIIRLLFTENKTFMKKKNIGIGEKTILSL